MSNQEKDALAARVLSWLNTEGFPTEFKTSAAFRAGGFQAHQGYHYRGSSGLPREIDVVATRTLSGEGTFVRCEFVIECKYVKEKPWIVFTDKSSKINPAACVAQTMGSEAGNAILWIMAGSPEMQSLSLFSVPPEPGFGGRQSFSKGDDQFYRAMATVTSASAAIAKEYDDRRESGTAPKTAVCVFPVVVVEGPLFRAWHDSDLSDMTVEEVDTVRCHWRGAPDWDWHATVDVVSLSALPEYVRKISNDVNVLLPEMLGSLEELAQAFQEKSLEGLGISRGSRGMTGLHPLLLEIIDPSLRDDQP